MKQIYISARAKTRLEEVKQIKQKLEKMGHRIAYDWTTQKVKRPYRDSVNRSENIEIQKTMLEKAANADVFILLDEPGLRGAYVELGVFLHNCLTNSERRYAYIVGPDSHEREFIFESPKYVKFVDTIDEVYEDLKQNNVIIKANDKSGNL